jgi:hypothetical protein
MRGAMMDSRRLSFAACFLFCAFLLPAQETLRNEFWAQMEPYDASSGVPISRSPAEGLAVILATARTCYSGMIYGWTFLYVPSDATRQIAERFKILPEAEIPPDDPGLETSEFRSSAGRYYAWVDYRLDPRQQARRDSWDSSGTPPSQGIGRANLLSGEAAFSEAFSSATRDMIRAYLRPVVLNKPRSIRGSLELEKLPEIGVASGELLVQARFRIRIDEVESYSLY